MATVMDADVETGAEVKRLHAEVGRLKAEASRYRELAVKARIESSDFLREHSTLPLELFSAQLHSRFRFDDAGKLAGIGDDGYDLCDPATGGVASMDVALERMIRERPDHEVQMLLNRKPEAAVKPTAASGLPDVLSRKAFNTLSPKDQHEFIVKRRGKVTDGPVVRPTAPTPSPNATATVDATDGKRTVKRSDWNRLSPVKQREVALDPDVILVD